MMIIYIMNIYNTVVSPDLLGPIASTVYATCTILYVFKGALWNTGHQITQYTSSGKGDKLCRRNISKLFDNLYRNLQQDSPDTTETKNKLHNVRVNIISWGIVR